MSIYANRAVNIRKQSQAGRLQRQGGFTTVAAMPNTRPVPDTVENLEALNRKIEETAHVRVLPYASITIREAGKELTDFLH